MQSSSHTQIRPTRHILVRGERHTIRVRPSRGTDRQRALAEQMEWVTR